MEGMIEMMVKWFIGGAVICGIYGAVTGLGFIVPAIAGGIIAVNLRKWVFGFFWK